MKIKVIAKTNSAKSDIERQADGSFKAFLKSLPIDGKANEEIISLAADYFDVPKSLIRIVSGHTSKIKIIEIDG